MKTRGMALTPSGVHGLPSRPLQGRCRGRLGLVLPPVVRASGERHMDHVTRSGARRPPDCDGCEATHFCSMDPVPGDPRGAPLEKRVLAPHRGWRSGGCRSPDAAFPSRAPWGAVWKTRLCPGGAGQG